MVTNNFLKWVKQAPYQTKYNVLSINAGLRNIYVSDGDTML